jgi:hypothetical protein
LPYRRFERLPIVEHSSSLVGPRPDAALNELADDPTNALPARRRHSRIQSGGVRYVDAVEEQLFRTCSKPPRTRYRCAGPRCASRRAGWRTPSWQWRTTVGFALDARPI